MTLTTEQHVRALLARYPGRTAAELHAAIPVRIEHLRMTLVRLKRAGIVEATTERTGRPGPAQSRYRLIVQPCEVGAPDDSDASEDDGWTPPVWMHPYRRSA